MKAVGGAQDSPGWQNPARDWCHPGESLSYSPGLPCLSFPTLDNAKPACYGISGIRHPRRPRTGGGPPYLLLFQAPGWNRWDLMTHTVCEPCFDCKYTDC